MYYNLINCKWILAKVSVKVIIIVSRLFRQNLARNVILKRNRILIYNKILKLYSVIYVKVKAHFQSKSSRHTVVIWMYFHDSIYLCDFIQFATCQFKTFVRYFIENIKSISISFNLKTKKKNWNIFLPRLTIKPFYVFFA